VFDGLGSATTRGLPQSSLGSTYTIQAITVSGSQRTFSIGSSGVTALTLRLTGATINSVGNVILRNSGTGSLTIASNVSNTGPMALDLGNSTDNVILIDNSGAITISATVTGASRTLTLSGSGSGALTLSASNTYTGTTQLTSGILRAGNDGAFSSSLLLLNGGTLSSDSTTARSFANNVRLGGNVTFGDGVGTGALSFGNLDLGGTDRTVTTVVSTTFAGAVTNGSLTKAGAATLSLNNSGNSFGTLTINAGTASIGANTAITGLAGAGGGLNLSAGTLTVTQASSGTYAGVLSGAGSLTKAGAGALTLSGNSSGYTGTATVSAGTLVANGNLGGSVSVANGGTLAGSGTVGSVTVTNGATLSPGTSPGVLTTGNLTWEGGGNYNWQLYDASLAAGTGYDSISSSGTLTINATSGNKFNVNLWTLSGTNRGRSRSAPSRASPTSRLTNSTSSPARRTARADSRTPSRARSRSPKAAAR
jgi:autotransporter-associated beta strand protein